MPPSAGSSARPVAVSTPYPLGLSARREVDDGAADEHVVNVAVYAPGAVALDIYFCPPRGRWQRSELADYTEGVHHGGVTGLVPGSRYGFAGRQYSGAWQDRAGLVTAGPVSGGPAGSGRADGRPALLLDPYGRAIDEAGDGESSELTSVRVVSDFDWGTDRHPATPWRNSVIYEAHVRGLTKLHPGIPEALRGTYAGLAHPVMTGYLRRLGITAVELLPVHHHLDEPHLQELGLSNYWGYNSIGFFAPQPSYATAAARAAGAQAVQDEFKMMVKALHEAGLEVILDVVYNHTAEGGVDGPTLCWRGLGAQQYYRHGPDGGYLDTTGCGNTLDFSEPRVIQLALDSLRYWVEEFHIDGFRFDLAVTLCRDEAHHFTARHPFLVAVAADQVLSGTKLIAEPWDVGHDGWQTGAFPPGWADWNDRYRDTVRDFWLRDQAAIAGGGTGGSVARIAAGLAGSAELFAPSGRTTLASLNIITAHDGFTLADLVSYNRKHNEANGEDNRDGSDHNRSYNHGAEGPTHDDTVRAARSRTSRNMLATLLLSLGVPMLTAGDEFGRSQRGNNNAYCQDNELAWVRWDLDHEARALLRTTSDLIRIRQEFLAHQPHSYPARPESSYLLWFNAAGDPMTREQWTDPGNRLLQLLLGSAEGFLDGLMVVNGSPDAVRLTLPTAGQLAEVGMERAAGYFELRLSTAGAPDLRRGVRIGCGESELIEAYSISIYRAG